MDQNKPEKKFSTGAISAAVWNNKAINKDGENSEFRTITLTRVYKDKTTGSWRNSSTLRINDLPKASLVLNKASKYATIKDTDASESAELNHKKVKKNE